ncbi:MAG: thioredoxin family protein [Cyanobacteria bacterium RUI128]|nr:thioredoxin family protein [Cyanobacteria bacterium RUI128]
MNKNIVILVLVFVLPLFAYFMLSKTNNGSMTVAETGSPQLIKFTSDMCGECKRVEPVVNKVMAKYQDSVQYIVIPVQVRNKYNVDMMTKYNVTLVPTIILLDKNRKVVHRIEGYVAPDTLDNYLRDICK